MPLGSFVSHLWLVASGVPVTAERSMSLVQGFSRNYRVVLDAEKAQLAGLIGFDELPAASQGGPSWQGFKEILAATGVAAIKSEGVKELLQAYRPCAGCQKKIRVGTQKQDGGYIMCDELLNGSFAAYSYGIKGADDWGAAISDRLRVPVRQYDCFNTTEPPCPEGMTCNFEFHAECVGLPKAAGKTFKSLKEQMAAYGDVATQDQNTASRLLMKMDIEGSEWEILGDPANRPLLQQFSQIVVELHGSARDVPNRLGVMQNMLQDFVVVHIHGNNCCGSIHKGKGWSIPRFLEVTFVRRGLVKETECSSDPEVSDLDRENTNKPPLESPRLPS